MGQMPQSPLEVTIAYAGSPATNLLEWIPLVTRKLTDWERESSKTRVHGDTDSTANSASPQSARFYHLEPNHPRHTWLRKPKSVGAEF